MSVASVIGITALNARMELIRRRRQGVSWEEERRHVVRFGLRDEPRRMGRWRLGDARHAAGSG